MKTLLWLDTAAIAIAKIPGAPLDRAASMHVKLNRVP